MQPSRRRPAAAAASCPRHAHVALAERSAFKTFLTVKINLSASRKLLQSSKRDPAPSARSASAAQVAPPTL